MEQKFIDRLKAGWNTFRNPNRIEEETKPIGISYPTRPDRPKFHSGVDKSIVTSLYNRCSIDVAGIDIQHVRLDENNRFAETIDSGLNNCLTLEANIDQSARAFIQDIVISLFDEGSVAVVPVDTTFSLRANGSIDILTMRTGKIVEWYPEHVRVTLYNDQRGQNETIRLRKTDIAIIENPFYALMNEPNSVLKRLVRKLNLLDAIDEQSGSGKLDLIIQLPYVVKTDTRRLQAETRRKDIEAQLMGSKYGIAYVDGTEKITQLNRPSENNLMDQIEFLTSMLYSQLGMTESIINGTADEQTLLNYYNRTVYPIVLAITDAIKRSFLTKTARSQKQSIMYFRNAFGFVPAKDLGAIADQLTRNEIATANEFRSIIGWKPSSEKGADELRNKNLNPVKDDRALEPSSITSNKEISQNGRQ